MASSRKCADSLERALADGLAHLARTGVGRIGVAVSGGLDSTVLAVYAAAWARSHGVALHCLHINHGLQTMADQWQAQVHDLALALTTSQSASLAARGRIKRGSCCMEPKAPQTCGGEATTARSGFFTVPCHSLRVAVVQGQGLGLEAAARAARYDGLAQLAQHVGVRHVLLAHHRDDQAETVLLRLLRGSGSQGLAAMRAVSQHHDLVLLRPLLDVDRRTLEQAFARWQGVHRWQAAQDPSNTDVRHTRSALRKHLVPALDARWPAWRSTLARHAQLNAQTNEILREVVEQDFARLAPAQDGASFDLAAWRLLSPARQALALRHWLFLHGLPAPSEARLRDVLRQLRGLHALGHDRHLRVRHDRAWIVCVRGRVGLQWR